MDPSELDHAEAHCLCDRVGAADGLELVEKRGDMKLDGVDGYPEAQRDGFVRRALGQEGQDLYFRGVRAASGSTGFSAVCEATTVTSARSFTRARRSPGTSERSAVSRSASVGSSTLMARTINSTALSPVKSRAFRSTSGGPQPAHPLAAGQA